MKVQELRHFTQSEDATWGRLFQRLDFSRESQAHPLFKEGVQLLEIPADRVPDLDEVNRRLQRLTGFRGLPVEGLEDAASFFEALSKRVFPIGNFLRDAADINYTPAPDIFHDLYGHLPMLANHEYATFSQRFGAYATQFSKSPDILREFERLYWFGVEFSLIQTNVGKRIFGAGILSSFDECNYALSDQPKVLPFNLEVIRRKDYHIDRMQTELFMLRNVEELYDSLEALAESQMRCGKMLTAAVRFDAAT